MRKIIGHIQNYDWGSPTAIPEILGQPATGQPQAEYWIGAHPLFPADLADGSGTLAQLFNNQPELMGDNCREVFDDTYPVLVKFLAAAKPLSLQAHPDREQAELGFTRENGEGIDLNAANRTYKDTWPKPELLVALTDFDGLCGFRDPAQTLELFAALGPIQGLNRVIGPLGHRKAKAALPEVLLDILSTDSPSLIERVTEAAHAHINDPGPVGRFAQTAIELDLFFPSQPSIMAALLLNRVHLTPGQGLFVPPGQLHSYIHGTGLEILARSDNVIRGGLTNKFIDVDELIHIVNFTPSQTGPVDTVTERGWVEYLTPVKEFTCWRGDLDSTSRRLPRTDACRLAIQYTGQATFTCPTETITLNHGESGLIPYGDEVTVTGTGQLFVASPGV